MWTADQGWFDQWEYGNLRTDVTLNRFSHIFIFYFPQRY